MPAHLSSGLRPDIRAIIDPAGPAVAPVPVRPVPRGIRSLPAAWVAFYRDPGARLALILTSLLLCYGGGAIMFWFHAVYLAEGGPAISWMAHWLLDSSFAVAALTPVLAVILPLAVWTAQRLSAADSPHLTAWLYAVTGGAAFALAATPGPIAHDLFVGRGTWIARRATELIGDPSATLAPVADYPLLAALAQQLGAGLPLYIALMALTVPVLRLLVRRRVPIG